MLVNRRIWNLRALSRCPLRPLTAWDQVPIFATINVARRVVSQPAGIVIKQTRRLQESISQIKLRRFYRKSHINKSDIPIPRDDQNYIISEPIDLVSTTCGQEDIVFAKRIY